MLLLPLRPHCNAKMTTINTTGTRLTTCAGQPTLCRYASHAPGGIGAFDATMLLALTQFPREDLIARLILFRLVCYLAPGIVALSLLAIRQVWLTCHRTLQI